jgi:hypothetical protein
MMKTWQLVSVGIVLLSGCTEVKYVKGVATAADFEADHAYCQNQILMSPIGPAIPGGQMGKPGVREGIDIQAASQSAQRDLDQCLRSKGWVLETEAK